MLRNVVRGRVRVRAIRGLVLLSFVLLDPREHNNHNSNSNSNSNSSNENSNIDNDKR